MKRTVSSIMASKKTAQFKVNRLTKQKAIELKELAALKQTLTQCLLDLSEIVCRFEEDGATDNKDGSKSDPSNGTSDSDDSGSGDESGDNSKRATVKSISRSRLNQPSTKNIPVKLPADAEHRKRHNEDRDKNSDNGSEEDSRENSEEDSEGNSEEDSEEDREEDGGDQEMVAYPGKNKKMRYISREKFNSMVEQGVKI
jgi:hypothetical protein